MSGNAKVESVELTAKGVLFRDARKIPVAFIGISNGGFAFSKSPKGLMHCRDCDLYVVNDQGSFCPVCGQTTYAED